MRRIRDEWRRLRGIGRRADVDARFDEEVRFHVDQQTEKNERAGMPPAEARREALAMFGGVAGAKDQARAEARPAWIDGTLRDLRHGIRGLRRTPVFTMLAVLTIAVGIGATTAVFTVLNAVLLRPLPYRDADRLVEVTHRAPGLDLPGGVVNLATTQLVSYREHNTTFEAIGLWTRFNVTVTGDGPPEQIRCLQVTHDTLQALDVVPASGRPFTPADEAPGSPDTILLAHGFSQRRFGGDPSIVGRTILIDSRPRQVVGVMPQDFRFLADEVDVLLPLQVDRSQLRLGGFNLRGVARLKPGVTIAAANADVARMIPGWLQAWPAPAGVSHAVFESARFTPDLRPLKEALVGDIGDVLWVVMGAVAVVLLIGCANVANLLLVRGEGRQQELAIRSALGAARGRLARALVIESLVLSLAGGLCGLLLAAAGVRGLVAYAADLLPRAHDIAIDPVALIFTLAVSVGSGLLFGLMSVVRRGRPDIVRDLAGAGGRTASQGRDRRRARHTLVVVQVSLATVLLVASGLMTRTFVALSHVDPGFTSPETLQLVRVTIPGAQVAEPERVLQMQRDIQARMAAVPGVASVAFASSGPLQRAGSGDPVEFEHRTYGEGQVPPIRLFKFIAPGYFQTIGARVIAGRDIDWSDLQADRPVAVVVESLAREAWGSPAAALGGRLREYPSSPWREVVGVVADIRDQGLHVPAPSTVYFPVLARNFGGSPVRIARSVAFVLRTERAGTETLLADLREVLGAINGNVPLAEPRTVAELHDGYLAQTSVTLMLLGVAGGMALLLSLIGIYGVLSHAAALRTREIGIRAALGARRASLRVMFVRDGPRLSLAGVIAGLAIALVLTRYMTALLFGVGAVDPMTYVVVAVVLTAAAALASYVPAHRATSVNPVEVLRAP